jgi:hypothetical protein
MVVRETPRTWGRTWRGTGFAGAPCQWSEGVIILQPGWYASGSGAVYGHAARIESIAPASAGAWFVGMRSANQTGKQFTDAGCANVTFRSIGPIPAGERRVSYWRPPAR